jgi:lipopolysaccharide transport system ATP-binding protein
LSSADPIIRFREVCKDYPRQSVAAHGLKNLVLRPAAALRSLRRREVFRALDGVTFDIMGGECVGLIGRNGSGKSTTLGLIAGVLRPSAGEMRVRGRISPLLQVGAGFHPELTGRENVFLNGILLGQTRAQVRARYDEIVAFSELGDFVEQPLRTFSTGMQARLGFSVAAHIHPEVLLVDEVLAVGDAAFKDKCLDRIKALRDLENVTTVIVSHSIKAVVDLCNRALLLDHGRLLADGAPDDVAERYFEVLGRRPSAATA